MILVFLVLWTKQKLHTNENVVAVAGDSWIEVDESLSEQLLPADDEESDEISVDSSISGSELSIGSSINTLSSSTASNGNYRYYI